MPRLITTWMIALLMVSVSGSALGQSVADNLTAISQALRGGKLPDQALLQQAIDNPSSVDLAAQVDEWLNSEDFYTNMEIWHRQIFRSPFLERSDIEVLDYAPEGLRESLAEEPVQLALFILRQRLPYTDMLESKLAIRNPMLKAFYAGGDPTGAATNDWKPVWREDHEAGVLTLKSMHLRNPTTVVNRWRTHANQVLEQWACQVLGEVDSAAPEDDDAHGTNPACISCHRPLDGIGTFFARWDRAGNYDRSADIDDRGSFYETINLSHQGNGLADLGTILSGSQRFAQCMLDKSWKFLSGRAMTETEAEGRSDLLRQFWQSGYDLKALFKEIVLSEEFLGSQN